ncbi:hypothetical protein HMPREF9333_00640 [Johnsonella ignava ATCC 51276]|jgi:Phosphotransferase System HPr (HPr) Family|uniref:HPr domain-containing protein n=1 Tax=Johnsonella ignava ATCC 51276 TaxID=679200 RepID=G5GGF0_9FIRM|nr:HPr family phosphocarrier protein [Johnsonella ignava]EHI56110.1 hypothetical protein HMPREF9333_00640 [Johnsonella ignava ATCC 51276]
MIKKTITPGHNFGSEAKPVAMLVQLASRFKSSIYIESEDAKVNAKSIMGMMTLALKSGNAITVIAEGDDEHTALQGIEDYLCEAAG